MPSTRASKPRYAVLGDELQASIERGDYPVGTLLPTELELCERYSVSRHTARAALAQLIRAGLVSRRPGAGTRVIALSAAMRYEHEIDSIEDLLQYGNSTRLEVLGTERGDFVKQGIDVAIHSGRPSELSLVGRPLMLRPWVIAAAPEYLARFGSPERPEDLLSHRCLNFTIRTQWNRWTFHESSGFKTIDIPSHIGSNQGELLRTLALLGLGVVRLAHFNIAADLASGALVPLLSQYQERSEEDRFYLLYPSGRSLAPRVRAVVDFLAEQLSTDKT